jgi:hypothetical protein
MREFGVEVRKLRMNRLLDLREDRQLDPSMGRHFDG